MGYIELLPIEFTECIVDSPMFRQKLQSYERGLESTNCSLKSLTKDIKDLVEATKFLSRSQRSFASGLERFCFEFIGGTKTDDEIVIASSLKEFSRMINSIEDERQRIVDQSYKQIICALDRFRRSHIGAAKESRKKFEKNSQKFCTVLERHLCLSTKKHEDQAMKEADMGLQQERETFLQSSLDYVCQLREVHERKKFDLVETLLSFMYGWITFYHQGYEASKDYKPFMTDLQMRIQRTRDEFEDSVDQVEALKNKILQNTKYSEQISETESCNKQGYLYLMEKKAFATTWTKHFCIYTKSDRKFTLIPYSQLTGKLHNSSDQLILSSCVRRMSDSIDRRFCFDVTTEDSQTYTLQALSEQDRRCWINAMDGSEPTYVSLSSATNRSYQPPHRVEAPTSLNELGVNFISKCIAQLEGRGLEEQGLYRIVGVSSKVNQLVQLGMSKSKFEKISLDNSREWESKTLTSAIKNYLRNLSEPIMTFQLYKQFVNAAKNLSKETRLNEIQRLVYCLPKLNLHMLKLIIQHLRNVSAYSDRNLMSVSNLAVCFGPTLMWSEQESLLAIMDVKFCNLLIELLTVHFETIFQHPSTLLRQPVPTKQTNSENSKMNGSGFAIISATAQLAKVDNCDDITEAAQERMISAADSTFASRRAAYMIAANRSSTGKVAPSISSASICPPPYSHPPSAVKLAHAHAVSTEEIDSDRDDTYAALNKERRKVLSAGCGVSSTNCLSVKSDSSDSLNTSHDTLNTLKSSARQPHVPYTHADSHATVATTTTSSLSCSNLYLNQSASTLSRISNLGLGASYLPSYRSNPDMLVRTLYACESCNSSELSFESNQIITHVRPSREPGWLEGCLNGQFGMIPENYVEYLP